MTQTFGNNATLHRWLFASFGLLLGAIAMWKLCSDPLLSSAQASSPKSKNLEAQGFLTLLSRHRNRHAALGSYSLLSTHTRLMTFATKWAKRWAVEQSILDQFPDTTPNQALLRWMPKQGYSHVAHVAILETSSIKPVRWIKRWLQRDVSRRAMEWIGFNELGLGVARTPRNTWLVVLILGSNPTRLWGGFQRGSFVQIKEKGKWRLGVVQGTKPVTQLRRKRCTSVPLDSSCYTMQDLRIDVRDSCTTSLRIFYLRRKMKGLRRLTKPIRRYRTGDVVSFHKQRRWWLRGVIHFEANTYRKTPLHYGIAFKDEILLTCVSDIRTWKEHLKLTKKKKKPGKRHASRKRWRPHWFKLPPPKRQRPPAPPRKRVPPPIRPRKALAKVRTIARKRPSQRRKPQGRHSPQLRHRKAKRASTRREQAHTHRRKAPAKRKTSKRRKASAGRTSPSRRKVSKKRKVKPRPRVPRVAKVRWELLRFRLSSKYPDSLEFGGRLRNVGNRTAKIELLVEAERPSQKKPKRLRRYVTFFAPGETSSFLRYIPKGKPALYRLTIRVNGKMDRTFAFSTLRPAPPFASRPVTRPTTRSTARRSGSKHSTWFRKRSALHPTRLRSSSRRRRGRLPVVFPREQLEQWPWSWIWPQ